MNLTHVCAIQCSKELRVRNNCHLFTLTEALFARTAYSTVFRHRAIL